MVLRTPSPACWCGLVGAAQLRGQPASKKRGRPWKLGWAWWTPLRQQGPSLPPLPRGTPVPWWGQCRQRRPCLPHVPAPPQLPRRCCCAAGYAQGSAPPWGSAWPQCLWCCRKRLGWSGASQLSRPPATGVFGEITSSQINNVPRATRGRQECQVTVAGIEEEAACMLCAAEPSWHGSFCAPLCCALSAKIALFARLAASGLRRSSLQ